MTVVDSMMYDAHCAAAVLHFNEHVDRLDVLVMWDCGEGNVVEPVSHGHLVMEDSNCAST